MDCEIVILILANSEKYESTVDIGLPKLKCCSSFQIPSLILFSSKEFLLSFIGLTISEKSL